ncbi:phosphoglycolate phosphatase [Actinomycetota bacterium]|nr:phosphoglycolate phosphatase [Actinomycetota bacterium]
MNSIKDQFSEGLKAVSFDFDGVICDSEKYWNTLMVDFVSKHINYTMQDQMQVKGMSQHDSWEKLYNEFGLQLDYQEYFDGMQKLIEDMYYTTSKPVDGLIEVLEYLKSQGITIGVATSSRKVWVRTFLEKFNLLEYFDDITTSEDVEKSKPDPAIYKLSIERLGVKNTQAIVIEDSRNGIVAGNGAGVFTIGLLTDMNEAADIEDSSITLSGYGEVLDFLKS